MTWGQALGNIRLLAPDIPAIRTNTKFIYDYIKRLQAERENYKNVTRAAWHVHQVLWFYGENNAFPEELEELPALDAILSDALSRVPPVEEGE
jgi:hypothetical protein